jgi:hypothetical protein
MLPYRCARLPPLACGRVPVPACRSHYRQVGTVTRFAAPPGPCTPQSCRVPGRMPRPASSPHASLACVHGSSRRCWPSVWRRPSWLRNFMGDEGRAFGFGDQVADRKPLQAAVVKSNGGERCRASWQSRPLALTSASAAACQVLTRSRRAPMPAYASRRGMSSFALILYFRRVAVTELERSFRKPPAARPPRVPLRLPITAFLCR